MIINGESYIVLGETPAGTKILAKEELVKDTCQDGLYKCFKKFINDDSNKKEVQDIMEHTIVKVVGKIIDNLSEDDLESLQQIISKHVEEDNKKTFELHSQTANELFKKDHKE